MDFPKVIVQQGVLKGYKATALEGKEYYSFCGIPYAEPPVGDLRFKDPVPIANWSGVKDATENGNKASQVVLLEDFLGEEDCLYLNVYRASQVVLLGDFLGEEDCLYLNVHTPQLPSKGLPLLPVMVCIHGGGFIYGSGTKNDIGPDYTVQQDVILVSMNYRLGIFGFLCLESIEAPGNMGLKDQNLALKWVQQNIKAFNGDPNNVTIYGISAGGASVEYHTLSPLSKGLFQKAIIQSGSVLNPWARSRDPKKYVQRLIKYLGGDCTDPEEIVEFLSQFNAVTLLRAAFSIHNQEDVRNGELFAFVPVVCSINDHEDFLSEDLMEILKSGNFNKVPVISGFCEKEGIYMKQFYKNKILCELVDGNYAGLLPKLFTIERTKLSKELQEIYKAKSSDKNPDEGNIDFLSDLWFIGGMYKSLAYRLKYCPENYLYCFTHDGNINDLKIKSSSKKVGACHGDETSYLMTKTHVDPKTATPKDVKERKRLVEMWTRFAKIGNPTPSLTDDINAIWTQITEIDFSMMNIGEELEVLKKDLFPVRKTFWENLYNAFS